MKRFWAKANGKMFLLVLFFLLFVIVSIIAAAGMSGFREYIDVLVILKMFLFTLATIVLTGQWKDLRNGFRFAFSRCRDISRIELEKASFTNRYVVKVGFLLALVITVVEFVDMLYRMDDLTTLGPHMAAFLLSVLYAVLLAVLLTIVNGKLEIMLISFMEEPEETEARTLEEEQRIYFKLRAMGLTEREAEVARLAGGELTNREIGKMLYISDNTVKKHITHILEKTGTNNREELAKLMREM